MVSSTVPVLTCLPRSAASMMGISGLFDIALRAHNEMRGMAPRFALPSCWRLSFILIGALRIIAACLLALSATLASSATILVYGDSLSAGYGLPADKAWPSLLAARLQKERF